LSQNSPCSIATDYAVRISKCTTKPELEAIGQEIKANLKQVVGFEGWLRDFYESKLNFDLNAPVYKPEDILNKEGLKKLAKGEL
jgi:hypothetical protein